MAEVPDRKLIEAIDKARDKKIPTFDAIVATIADHLGSEAKAATTPTSTNARIISKPAAKPAAPPARPR